MPHPWLQNPDNRNAPEQLSDLVGGQVAQEWSEQVAGRADDATDWLRTEQAQAIIEHETLRRTARVRNLADKALRFQSVRAAASSLHRYHPQEFETLGEMLRDALADIEPQASTPYDLEFIIETLLPMMADRGIPGAEVIYRDGTLTKSRRAANYLRKLFDSESVGPGNFARASEELTNTVREVVADIANEDVTVADFTERWNATRPAQPPMPAYKYLGRGQRTVFVIECDTRAQERLVEQALAKRLNLHLGTGEELLALQVEKIDRLRQMLLQLFTVLPPEAAALAANSSQTPALSRDLERYAQLIQHFLASSAMQVETEPEAAPKPA